MSVAMCCKLLLALLRSPLCCSFVRSGLRLWLVRQSAPCRAAQRDSETKAAYNATPMQPAQASLSCYCIWWPSPVQESAKEGAQCAAALAGLHAAPMRTQVGCITSGHSSCRTNVGRAAAVHCCYDGAVEQRMAGRITTNLASGNCLCVCVHHGP